MCLLAKKWWQEQIHCCWIKPQLISHYSSPVFSLEIDDCCGAFCPFIFRAAVFVPPHPGGWQENCMDSQFTRSLGFKRGEQRRFPVYSMGLPFKTPCAILSKPVVSLWKTKAIGSVSCNEVTLLAKVREHSLMQEREGASACTALCLFQMQATLCHLWDFLPRRN